MVAMLPQPHFVNNSCVSYRILAELDLFGNKFVAASITITTKSNITDKTVLQWWELTCIHILSDTPGLFVTQTLVKADLAKTPFQWLLWKSCDLLVTMTFYTPAQRSWRRVYWNHLVRLSVLFVVHSGAVITPLNIMMWYSVIQWPVHEHRLDSELTKDAT